MKLEVLESIDKILFDYAKIKEGEEVLLLSDREIDFDIIEGFQLQSYKHNLSLSTIIMLPDQLRKVPNNINRAMENSNVIIVCTGKKFYGDLSKMLDNGGRVLSIGRVSKSQITQAFSVDQHKMNEEIESFVEILSKSEKAEIYTAIGTELTLELERRKIIIVNGEISAGESSSFPGSICFTPLEPKSKGKIVVDSTIGWLAGNGELKNYIVRDPVELYVEEGKVTRVTGGLDSLRLDNFLKQGDDGPRVIAEVGLGFNSAIEEATGTILLDESLYGAVHIGIGNNIHLGGKNKASQHVDVILEKASIKLNGELVIENGKLLR